MLNNTRAYVNNSASRSIGFLFMLGSMLLGIWAAAIPQIKTRLGFSDATLGLTLLLAPVGALTGVIVSSFLFKKIPVGKWLVAGNLLYCLVFIAQVAAFSPILLWLSLFLTGLLGFLNGVSTNAIVDLLEKKDNRHLMSTSHGMYSVGGFISAALAAIFYSLRMPPIWQITLVAVLLMAIILYLKDFYLSFTHFIEADTGFRLPSGSVVGLAFICFVTFMGERHLPERISRQLQSHCRPGFCSFLHRHGPGSVKRRPVDSKNW
jgi:Major Facilitator Superfamily